MNGNIATVLLTLLALCGAGAAIYGFVSRSQFLLRTWANENQYELLLAQNRVFRKGPFMWSGKSQTVYRVHVRDEQGNERKGWVRCGDWLLGVLADKVEARWDD